MGLREDIATAKAMKAHLEDQIDLGMEQEALRRAKILMFVGIGIVAILGVGYYGIRRRGETLANA